ncbi:nucleoside hydrolase-like domain-containing protein [Arcticibacter sp.]|uniref:nucleoside hydrolase-like domain-containing protein n=1 Tax=Arcticibacter sp. TaxID=1872630 RepID=UPI00388E3527
MSEEIKASLCLSLLPNLIKHDKSYPKPQYLRERTVLGNVKTEGEMDEVTAGSQLIVKVLLDENHRRPVWLQAWGGTMPFPGL